ncbi:MAG TPA: serine hydrolase domain-containing protein [Thermoanaerobaculia bacterium]|jgi:CubicO group peptidase (beta-lactamase class C family)
MRRTPLIALSALLIATGSVRGSWGIAPAAPPTPAERSARADALLKSWTAGAGAGCSAAVDLAGQTVWSGVSGDADLEHAAHITSTTPFDVGSLAKPVTALAVLLLVQDGKLALDDSIADRLPDLPAAYRPVHIRHLLSHTSGVPDWQDLLQGLAGFRRDDEVREDDVLRALRGRRALNFAPGTQEQYSNSNYVLLGELVRRISGMPLAELARTRIFTPLEMRDSRIVDDHTALIPGVANGYQHSDEPGPGGSSWELVPRTNDLVGPQNLYTTAGDLLKLLRAQTRSPWRELFARLQEPATLAGGKPALDAAGRRAGHGVWIQTLAGQTLLGHSGYTHGTRAGAFRVQETGAAVALLCNRNDVDPDLQAMQLLDVFTDSRWASLWREKPAGAPPIEPAPAGITHFAGVYQLPGWGMTYRLIATAEGLILNRPGRKLVALTDGSYTVTDAPGTRIRLEASAGGPRMVLLSAGATLPEIYNRVSSEDHYSPSLGEIQQRAGCYESPELGSSVVLHPGDDKTLRLVDEKGRAIDFQPMLPDLWRGGTQILDFDPSDGTAVRGFFRSTEIAWRVWYRRRPCVGPES